jgi:phenylalanine ammonia-lyase
VDFLDEELKRGRTVYGVNTGFGGSADTRTENLDALQVALQQHLNVGILLPSDKGLRPLTTPPAEGLRGHALPVPVVKAMMLIRCNSLMRGHSGVRISIVESILTMVGKNMTPVVPLRGSISASGDLSPLSYIAGMLEGNPDVFVRIGDGDNPTYLAADKALAKAGLQPIRLRAKEGLGIMNGTATSCAAACIAIHQAQQIAVLSQLLTAMGTEALFGTAHNYHPFISATRPHPGQTEAAANINAFLSGSKLAPDKDPQTIGLAQDRYGLRTAPQWIGPQLEDLCLAHRQVQAEVNSTTDNPLIDFVNGSIHHGGNFQAACITSAMEKTTTAMQMLGKLLYAQCAELTNNMLNKGLPPNLSADDPSLSFTFKGLDVNMAAYMSELAYIAHPISSHVQVAEMNNQSVNSLALVAARYTLEAVELVSLMAATYIYALCQALDLRCLHLEFVKLAEPAIGETVRKIFAGIVSEKHLDILASDSWQTLLEKWTRFSHLDLQDRGAMVAKESLGPFLQRLMTYRSADGMKETNTPSSIDILAVIEQYQESAGKILSGVYNYTREVFFLRQTTPSYISPASKMLYEFVRKDLNVPMHRGLIDHPTLTVPKDEDCHQQDSSRKIMGTLASEIYMAVRNGQIPDRVMDALELCVESQNPAILEKGRRLSESGSGKKGSPMITTAEEISPTTVSPAP